MNKNILKFKNDIKELVNLQKQGKELKWMHPIYCAYYIMKHGVEKEAFIEEDIKRSFRALSCDSMKHLFRKQVENTIKEYEEKTVCTC